MKPGGNLKRILLYLLIGSVVSAAILSIVLVLRSKWGWFEIRVILTTMTIAVASLCGLACDLSRTIRGSNSLPVAGLVLTAVAAVLVLFGMWADVDAEEFWKATASVSIFAVAITHVCLLSIARLAARYRWVYLVACQIIFGLALLLVVMIVGEIDDDDLFRVVAAIAILDAAVTLIIPILHRLSKADTGSEPTLSGLDQRNVASLDEEILRLKRRITELEKLREEIVSGG